MCANEEVCVVMYLCVLQSGQNSEEFCEVLTLYKWDSRKDDLFVLNCDTVL